MTKKISVASLPEFNSAHFLNDFEDIRTYIRIVKEEGDPVALGHALNKVFMALGANAVADLLAVDVSQIWEAHENPLENLNTLEQVCDVIENESLPQRPANRYIGTDFEEFLRAEGIYDEVTARAVRRVIAALLSQRSS